MCLFTKEMADESDVVTEEEISFEENLAEEIIELPDDIKDLMIPELRERLIKAGFKPGPFSSIQEQLMYKKKLYLQERKNIEEYGCQEELTPFQKIIYDIKIGRKVTIGETEHLEIENEFNQLKNGKCETDFFNYLLIDPTCITNLKNCSFEEFINAIFYTGKGTGDRPIQHLKNAARLKQGKPIRGRVNSDKLQRIVQIWERGNGVIILHSFSYISQTEALFRESAIIAALRLHTITNVRQGIVMHKLTPSGRVWNDQEIIRLGAYCVYKGWLLFHHDRKHQMYESNLPV